MLVAVGALIYSAIRFTEAFGLYFRRAWAEYLAAASGGIYLPYEFLSLLHDRTALHAGLLLGNAAVVAIMVLALVRRRRNTADRAT